MTLNYWVNINIGKYAILRTSGVSNKCPKLEEMSCRCPSGVLLPEHREKEWSQVTVSIALKESSRSLGPSLQFQCLNGCSFLKSQSYKDIKNTHQKKGSTFNKWCQDNLQKNETRFLSLTLSTSQFTMDPQVCVGSLTLM